MWRHEDEALHARLRDEAVLAAIWPVFCGVSDARPPTPRASGVFFALELESEPMERALLGHAGPLVNAMRPASYASFKPSALHHLALLESQAAEAALEARHMQDFEVSSLRSLSAWFALGDEGAYLADLANRAGEGLDELARQQAAQGAPLAAITQLASRATDHIESRDIVAATCIRVLRSMDRCIAGSGIEPDSSMAKRAKAHADRRRERLFEIAVAPLEERFEAASAHAPNDETLQNLEQAGRLFAFLEREPWVGHWIIDAALPIAWQLYKAKDDPMLRRLDTSLREVVDSLAARLQEDPSDVAFSARIAQMLVFRAELRTRLEDQIRDAELAISLCETHRNARLVAASALADRALRTLDRAPTFGRTSHLNRALADVRRARGHWDGKHGRLDVAIARLADEGISV